MTPVRLEPAASQSRVKHSTTEPLCSLHIWPNKITLCITYFKIFKHIKIIKYSILGFGLVCGFTSQSTAMVMLRQSAKLITLFPGQAWLSAQLNTFACNWQQPFLNQWKVENDTVQNISWSIYIKVWDWAGIKLTTPGSAIRLVTDVVQGPGYNIRYYLLFWKQCRSWSAGFWWSQLIKIHTFSSTCTECKLGVHIV